MLSFFTLCCSVKEDIFFQMSTHSCHLLPSIVKGKCVVHTLVVVAQPNGKDNHIADKGRDDAICLPIEISDNPIADGQYLYWTPALWSSCTIEELVKNHFL